MKNTAFNPLVPAAGAPSVEEIYLGKDLAVSKAFPGVQLIKGRYHIQAESTTKTGECSLCKVLTRKRHGTSQHSAQWMPLNGRPTVVHLKLNRYICTNPECPHFGHSFTEQAERLDGCKRNSKMIFLIVLAISFFCSCNGTALIAKEMGIDISHDTVRNIVNNIALTDDPDIEEIGVDDVANFKGISYLTAVYDARDHHLITLLDGRDGSTLKDWLRKHKKIRAIVRDRASAYAAAISEILPDCIQVADRFHILKNLTERLNEIFRAEIPAKIYIHGNKILHEEAKPVYISKSLITDPDEFSDLNVDNSAPTDKEGNPIVVNCIKMNRSGSKPREHAENRKLKQSKAIQVRRRKADADEKGEKLTQKKLAEEVGVSIPTIKKWLSLTEEEVQQMSEVNHYENHKSTVDGYENIIFKLLKMGKAPLFIKSYLVHIGCPASHSAIEHRISHIASNHFCPIGRRAFIEPVLPPDITVITRFDILKYIVATDKTKMQNAISAENYKLIREHYPVVARCEDVWNLFHAALMEKHPDGIDSFIARYKVTEETPKDTFTDQIGPFVNGLQMDIKAVKAAATYDLSSGFVEGGNCKFKEQKRVMFGRAGLMHLRQRCCIASEVSKCGTSVVELLQRSRKKASE